MKHNEKKFTFHNSKAELAINNTSKPQQVIAKVEAAILRKENQKVTEKSLEK
tara:strand:+ start:670 stop:825 length:156 start_codon:yes stop_codon:yes gene_type:complete